MSTEHIHDLVSQFMEANKMKKPSKVTMNSILKGIMKMTKPSKEKIIGHIVRSKTWNAIDFGKGEDLLKEIETRLKKPKKD